jgi:hypothetical protein
MKSWLLLIFRLTRYSKVKGVSGVQNKQYPFKSPQYPTGCYSEDRGGCLAVFLCIIYFFLKLCWLCASNGKDDFIKNWGRCLAGIFVVVFVIGFFQPIFSHVPEVIFCVLFSSITVLWRLNADGVKEAHQCSLDDSSFN